MTIDYSEKYIANKLNGKLTRASGAIMDDSDIRLDNFLIEVKRRSSSNNIVLFNLKVWEKLRKQCVKYNKMPLYIYQANKDIYCITYLDSFLWLDKVEYNINPLFIKNMIFKKHELNHIYSEINSIATFKWNYIKYIIIPLNILEEVLNG